MADVSGRGSYHTGVNVSVRQHRSLRTTRGARSIADGQQVAGGDLRGLFVAVIKQFSEVDGANVSAEHDELHAQRRECDCVVLFGRYYQHAGLRVSCGIGDFLAAEQNVCRNDYSAQPGYRIIGDDPFPSVRQMQGYAIAWADAEMF